MARAAVTDRGLARRLGETAKVFKQSPSLEVEGTLMYFPQSYAILKSGKRTDIAIGDTVALRRGKGFGNFEEGYLKYYYMGN